MEHRVVPNPPPRRLLACPHCGPETNRSTHGCSRCGGELLLFDAEECARRWPPRQAAARAQIETPPPIPAQPERRRSWAGGLGAALLVLALTGLLRFWGGPQPDAQPAPEAPAAPRPESPPPGGPVPPAGLESAAAGTAAGQPGDLEAALARYQAALVDQPDDPQLLDYVGQILVAMNRPAEAVPFLQRSVELEPFSLTARFDLAVAYGRCGRLTEAVDLYGELVQSGSTDHRIFHNLGLALRRLGRAGQAAAAFERATVLAPGHAPGWLGLAVSLEADGRAAEAASALERYLALEPDNPDADNLRARIARLRGGVEASAAAPDPGSPVSRRHP